MRSCKKAEQDDTDERESHFQSVNVLEGGMRSGICDSDTWLASFM